MYSRKNYSEGIASSAISHGSLEYLLEVRVERMLDSFVHSACCNLYE